MVGVDIAALTDGELQELGFQLYREGETLTAIGELLGRSIGRISRWKSNGKWEDRDLAIQTGGEDPGTAVGLVPIRETTMAPLEMNDQLKLVISRTLQRANESLENHDLDFKNIYHFKALVEMLKLLQEAERLAHEQAGKISEVRHVHVLDAPLVEQLRWIKAAIGDGIDVDAIVIPQEIGGDDS